MKNKVTSFSTLKKSEDSLTVFWFRRDLRLQDNHGLFQALRAGRSVLPVFIFDASILDRLNRSDARVAFIQERLKEIFENLHQLSKGMAIFHGQPLEVFKELTSKYNIEAIYTNEDYEPYAIKRDKEVQAYLDSKEIEFRQFKDQLVFHKDDILKDNGEPYKVFTPYSSKWKALYRGHGGAHSYPSEKELNSIIDRTSFSKLVFPTLKDIGFEDGHYEFPESMVSEELIHNYHRDRDIPGIRGTSRLGIHLRFGTISIRKLAERAELTNEIYLNELIWREFYAMILYQFPYVESGPFRKEYEALEWRNDEDEFERWKTGNTGIPIVDAGMRELNATGFMHNRVRMIAASFLCKNLLINWQWGERYFAEKLLDFDLASNNGGWQWVAGTGTDAAPYFRVFNPVTQQKKFDPDGKYVKQWVPEIATMNYPPPMVDLKASRERCLQAYKKAKEKG